MTALAQTYRIDRQTPRATVSAPPPESKFQMLNRQVEAERDAPKVSRDSAHIPEADKAFFAIPEFRLIPAHAEQVFAAAKEWEGTIESIGNSHFMAQLREIRPNAGTGTDLAEIPIGDVPPADRDLLREGAIFRYLVGYAKSSKGVTRKRHVYLRRGTKNSSDKTTRWLEIAAKFRNE